MAKVKRAKKEGSKLLAALGKTKKEQQKAVYPKIKSKGPYVRGTQGKKSGIPKASTFTARRAVMSGQPATKKRSMGAAEMAAHVVGAGATGYAVGKGWHKKLAGAVTPKKKETHREKAIRGAKELVKKQKKQKEKRKSHH
tara:strand:+ start:68 stop:487 length:420 start_codon:yes stop_codon:yes gene_type:complete